MQTNARKSPISIMKLVKLNWICHNDGGPLNLVHYMPYFCQWQGSLYITMTALNSAFTLRLSCSIFITPKEYEHTNIHLSPILRGQSICCPQRFRTRAANSFIIWRAGNNNAFSHVLLVFQCSVRFNHLANLPLLSNNIDILGRVVGISTCVATGIQKPSIDLKCFWCATALG